VHQEQGTLHMMLCLFYMSEERKVALIVLVVVEVLFLAIP